MQGIAAPGNGLEIHVAQHGICWGIDLALKRIGVAASQRGSVEATHRWAHNPAARRWDPLEFVRRRDPDMMATYPGLDQVEVLESIADSATGEVAVGHHGTIEDREASPDIQVLDYTCPFIARSDKQAAMMADSGYDLIIFGKTGNHHCEFAKQEVEARGRVAVIGEDVAAIADVLRTEGRNWACQGQVTANVESWETFRSDLDALGVPYKLIDTVCTDSHSRQDEAIMLAKRCDVAIVVNDSGGSTLSVFEQARAANPRTYRYDPLGGDVLDTAWLADARSVAVLGGIHVPSWVLARVAQEIGDLPMPQAVA